MGPSQAMLKLTPQFARRLKNQNLRQTSGPKNSLLTCSQAVLRLLNNRLLKSYGRRRNRGNGSNVSTTHIGADTETSAEKSSDLSATAVEFVPVQIMVLWRGAVAKVRWDLLAP